ncbi:MAG: hypothetical protein ACRCVN_01305 [Spirochaetia bacterium]
MNYLTNPYLWLFCLGFGTGKFLSWVFKKPSRTSMPALYERLKIRRVFYWFAFAIVSLLAVFLLYFVEPFTLSLAGYFCLTIFASIFLFNVYPHIFAIPVIAVLFIFSLVGADLEKNWIYVDPDIHHGIPLMNGEPRTQENRYLLYAGAKTQRKTLSLDLNIPAGTQELRIKLLEVHPLPIWFLWWPSNYFYIQEISTAKGEVLWKNETPSVVLKHLVGQPYGWVVNSNAFLFKIDKNVKIFWKAYDWQTTYAKETIASEEVFIDAMDSDG